MFATFLLKQVIVLLSFEKQKIKTMAKLILSHKVSDYNTWKKSYDSDKERRTANGVTEIAVGKKSDDPNMVYMIFDIKDIDNMNKMFSDPGLQKAMQEAGVMSKPEMVIFE
jgi:hypothetical protein